MKKLNVAIIGQGRSGRDIHGKYLLTENNKYYNVKYVVDADAGRRERAEKEYEGCKAFASYEELFDIKYIDLVVNSTFSQMHYPVTLDLLNHGFNVLVEKPFARTKLECQTLIETAREKGVVLAVFQQSFFAPYYVFAKQVAELCGNFRLPGFPVTGLRLENSNNTYSGGTVRDFHPIILFSRVSTATKGLFDCQKYCSTEQNRCQ